MPKRLSLQHITKRYPSVIANDDVSLTVAPGEIHAVLGENGAGKSTLMKIIYGAVQADDGAMLFDEVPVRVRNPHEARALGISMVFQHFSLFDTLTVAQNVWLGQDKQSSLADVTARIREKATTYGLDIDPMRPVHSLSVGERQRVEIVRALLTNPKLLILDEPTSVLTPQAVTKLFDTLRKLADTGCSILYISHKLDEIRALCHSCTVMRAGKVTGVVDPRAESNASLSRLMIGSEPPKLMHRKREPGELRLEVRRLSLPALQVHGTDLKDVSLQVRSGEIVGIAGVSGNGQQALLSVLSGEDTRASSDDMRMINKPIGSLPPAVRRERGLHFVPEERLGRGAVPSLTLAQNLLLTRADASTVGRMGWLNWRAVEQQTGALLARFGVKAAGPQATAKSLSGGNLQKYMMGREMEAKPRVLIVAQPTWGVDVGAASQIHAALLALRDEGCAVLVVSEEIEELFQLCDRLYVMANGRLSPSIATRDATVEQLGLWMSGLWDKLASSLGDASVAQEAEHAKA
jgi:general nucleoside transport system ATP-binding protein